MSVQTYRHRDPLVAATCAACDWTIRTEPAGGHDPGTVRSEATEHVRETGHSVDVATTSTTTLYQPMALPGVP